MRVTFDSNVYRRVVAPAKFPQDSHRADILLIHKSLQEGFLQGFLCESIVTLEAVRRAYRGDYFPVSI